MNRRTVPWILLLAVAVALVPAADLAASSQDSQTKSGQSSAAKKQPAREKSAEVPVVITNDTLEQLFGGAELPESSVTAEGAIPAVIEPPKTAEGPQTPSGEAAPAEVGQPAEPEQPVDTEARARQLEQQIERLNKRMLSLQNPLLRGVTPATEEERDEQAGMDNSQQIEQTRKRIADLQAELAELRGGG